MATAACKGAAKRLLRCFCGCMEMTEDEVQRIYRLSTQATLIDRQATKLLRSYLQLKRSGDKSEAEQFLDIYEKCGEYATQENCGILTLDELDELCDLGLPYHMEKELKLVIQTGECSNIERCLLRIQGECRNEIEASQEYKDYKSAILDKLRNKV
ncbi:uncharacterized protein LOC119680593 [Teleopsis dalmanni]|uniref:uncharacterized protein LOC119680593 n=1 Tax=Teleopsis dalmanni TaxID=139649 RepID=UPI0018CE5934|nr:uncharacterized protein LOC119680593 [Teleopsis dalmanni]